MCTWIRLLVFIHSFISSIFFLSNSKTLNFFFTLFCKAYKVATWHTHGQIVDLLCTPTTSSQNILVPLFFFFFLSLQWAKIKKLLLQNCFNIPMMARPGVCELCPLSAIFFFLTNSKTLIFCHTFLWVVQSWNLIHTWAKHWSIVYTKYKQPEYTCSFIFLLFSVSPIRKD